MAGSKNQYTTTSILIS